METGRILIGVLLISVCTFSESRLSADIILSQDAQLFGDGFIDWSQLPVGALSSGPFQVDVQGAGGPKATVSTVFPTHRLRRTTQGDGWNGNFAPGEELLYSVDGSRRFRVQFDEPVTGIGTQFQTSIFGNFTAFLTPLEPTSMESNWRLRCPECFSHLPSIHCGWLEYRPAFLNRDHAHSCC